MTEQEKLRKRIELYNAWLNEKTLQYYSKESGKFVDTSIVNMPIEIMVVNGIWRVKPDLIKKVFRVGVMRGQFNTIYSFIVSCVEEEEESGKHPGFIKWLTDRIEYEVEV